MNEEKPSSVIFRIHRREKDGAETTEEREVKCDPDSMRELLCTPWDTAPRAADIPPQETIGSLAQAVAEALSDLELVVRQTEEPAARKWTLGFRRVSDEEELFAESVDTSDKEKRPLRLKGQLKLKIRGDEESDMSCTSGEDRLRVMNTGLSITNVGNVYAILNLQLNLDIRPESSDAKPD